MGAHCYKDLVAHVGHEIKCVAYGEGPANVALECETCGQVLLDFDQAEPSPRWEPDSGWDDHPDYPRSDWEYEVSNGDTHLGYVDWVNNQLEMEDEEDEDDGS